MVKSLEKKGIPWWLIALVVVGIGAGAVWFLVISPRRAARNTVQTAPVERLSLPITVSANGVVQPERSVNVSPKNPGRVTKLYVDAGIRVKAGQVLARMDNSNFQGQLTQAQGQLAQSQANLQKLLAGSRPQEITQAQAQLRDAQSTLQLAEDNFKRNQTLYKDGAIALSTIDSARTERDRAQAGVIQAQQSLNLAKEGPRREDIAQARAQVTQARGAVENIQTQIDDTVIRAPFDGIITRKFADPGAFVAPTTAGSTVNSATSSSIMSLAGINQVVANVAEANISQIKLGQTATIQADAYTGKSFQGKVIQIAPQSIVSQNVTSFEVKVAIVGDKEGLLLSGMNVDVEFQVGRLNNTLMVPTVAIVRQENQTGVYVAGEDNKPTFTQIETGVTVDNRTAVLKGLEGSEKIYISFPEGFRPESRVPGISR